MKQIIYTALLCMLPVFSGKAQSVYNEHIRIDNLSVSRSDDNRLTIAMDVILKPELKVAANQASTFTPILKTSTYNKILPAVVVYGHRRQVVNERNHFKPQNAYTTILRKNNNEQKVNYLVQLPYEAWMQQADLNLDLDVKGCCRIIEEELTETIYRLNIEPANPKPHIAYITPKPELIKHRSSVGKAFLDFPVNQTVINPDYRKNNDELAKIRATIDTIRNDQNTSITSIMIEGFASPEGSYESNANLAAQRTKALMTYVRNYYHFDEKLLKMQSTPEDWAGFRSFIEQSEFTQKYDILNIMDSNEPNYDIKEKQIAKLVGPEIYRTILNECYPKLRHSDYTVSYTVRGFSIDESKEIIQKNPQLLSLQEIFNLAQTYEKGSPEFNHAFQVAVLMFPNDPTANLNAAAMEIQKGDNLTEAKKYLAKADQTHPATLNNLGVIAMLERDFKTAEAYFKKSESQEALPNLKEIEKLRNYPTK